MTDTPDVETVPKSTFDAEAAARAEAEKDLKDVLDGLIADVPEDLRGLIPEGSTGAKIRWLRAAKTKGIFAKTVPVPETDGGRRPSTTPKPVDHSTLPATARIAAGYAKK